jgi:hypothetical protein
VEVKAIAGKDDWLTGNLPSEPKLHHFVVLVAYDGLIGDPSFSPRCWIFRHEEVVPLMRVTRTGLRYLARKDVLRLAQHCEGRWSVLLEKAG